MTKSIYTNTSFFIILTTLVMICIIGITVMNINGIIIQPSKCIQTNDLQKTLNDTNLIQNQIAMANYVQAESQCLAQIKKCQIISDNNTSFTLGCFK